MCNKYKCPVCLGGGSVIDRETCPTCGGSGAYKYCAFASEFNERMSHESINCGGSIDNCPGLFNIKCPVGQGYLTYKINQETNTIELSKTMEDCDDEYTDVQSERGWFPIMAWWSCDTCTEYVHEIETSDCPYCDGTGEVDWVTNIKARMYDETRFIQV